MWKPLKHICLQWMYEAWCKRINWMCKQPIRNPFSLRCSGLVESDSSVKPAESCQPLNTGKSVLDSYKKVNTHTYYSRNPIWALLTSSGRRIWILDSTSSTQGGCDRLCDFSNMKIIEVLLQNIVNYFRLCFCRVRSSSNFKIAVCNSVHNSVHKHTIIVSE